MSCLVDCQIQYRIELSAAASKIPLHFAANYVAEIVQLCLRNGVCCWGRSGREIQGSGPRSGVIGLSAPGAEARMCPHPTLRKSSRGSDADTATFDHATDC